MLVPDLHTRLEQIGKSEHGLATRAAIHPKGPEIPAPDGIDPQNRTKGKALPKAPAGRGKGSMFDASDGCEAGVSVPIRPALSCARTEFGWADQTPRPDLPLDRRRPPMHPTHGRDFGCRTHSPGSGPTRDTPRA